MARTSYALGFGSNRYAGRSPREIVSQAIAWLEKSSNDVVARSSTIATRPLGPGGRCYANAAILLESELTPPELLALCKACERAFGRRLGRRWGPRTLDVDILLWSGGTWRSSGLVIPHPEMRERRFVLGPLAEIASNWRDPISGRTIHQLAYRLDRPIPVDRGTPAP